MPKKEAAAHTDTAVQAPNKSFPEELSFRKVNWKKCSDKTLLEEVSTQNSILSLLTEDMTSFKEEVYSNGYNYKPPEEEEEAEEDVCLSDLEEEVTAMHTMTMSRMPTDDDLFLSRLAALRADAAAAMEEEDE